MRIIRIPDEPPPAQPPEVVATIGNFDGVHLGHRNLIGKVVERAAEMGLHSAVVTFDPHPRLVLTPDDPVHLLSTTQDKAELLAPLGIDLLLVWRFDQETRDLPAGAFLERLNRWVRLRRLLHGPGFAIGRGREGSAEVIAAIGRRLGFDVEEVPPLALIAGGDRPVASTADSAPTGRVLSSSAIRALVEAGQIRRATEALGHPPTLTGTVVEGARLGRALGFPTANLRLDLPFAIPADGVYAAWAELAPYTAQARRVPAAVSIGTRPQFGGDRRVVEAHLLDFAGDLYGQSLRLHFVARLRGQERFRDVPALVAQMQRDVAAVRALLAAARDGHEPELLAADG
jgi:riboflavin kinase/FMN adenylyltransferase